MSHQADPQERIVKLELLVTHLERDLAALNAVLIDQQKQLDAVRRLLTHWEVRLGKSLAPSEPFDPQAERPPHY